MSELVELYQNGDDYELAPDGAGSLRIPKALWTRFAKATAALAAVEAEISKVALRPVYVTPEQEEAIRAVAKPGAWIVVRESTYNITTAPIPDDDDFAAVPLAPMPPEQPPAGPPKRPRPAACAARGGLPHGVLRYVITDGMSVYDPGRVRVDGLCQCGERIPDVKCPHQKQESDAMGRPACKWCRKVLVAGAGVIDNRKPQGHGGGARDPNVAIPIDPDNPDNPQNKFAYRAPE